MAIVSDLFVLGFIILLGLASQYIFKKTRIPDVLILIVFGAVLSAMGVANGVKAGGGWLTFLITFGLIYVVFYGALPIRLRAIFSTMKYALMSSILNFIFVTSIIGVFGWLLGFGWILGFSLGALFCVMDGSIINALLETIKLSSKAKAQVQTESAVIDTFVIVAILSILNFARMTWSQVLTSLVGYLLLSFAIGLVAALIWSFALKRVGDYGSAPIATMAVLVMLYAFGETVGANGAITVFSFAIILGNVGLISKLFNKNQEEGFHALDISTKSFFRDISFLLRTFLFVYLGILVDFSAWGYLLIGLVFFLVAYVIRSFIGRMIMNKNLTKRENYYLDAMCAKGLTPTVMLAVINADAAFSNIVIGGIFSSIVVTSILLYLIEKDRFTTVSDWILAKVAKKA